MYMNINKLKTKALSLGASEFGISDRKNKRYYVVYQDKVIHFGSKTGQTFIDHGDKIIRANWIARHSKIRNSKNELVMNLKTSASYWSRHILW